MKPDKKLLSTVAAVVLITGSTPALASAQSAPSPQASATSTVAGLPTAETLRKGPKKRSAPFDGFWKCMGHRTMYSNMGYGVSLTCFKDGGKWYYLWWEL